VLPIIYRAILPRLGYATDRVYWVLQSAIPVQYGRPGAADMGWISAGGVRCDCSVVKKTKICIHAEGSHSEHLPGIPVATSHHITASSFQRHQCQYTTGSLQSHKHLKECNKLSVRWKTFAFHKLVRWYFQMWWVSGLQFFFYDNVNNHECVWIILLKMTFLDFKTYNGYN